MLDFKLGKDIKGIKGEVPLQAKGAVWALGNFDGMHLGHQALLIAAKNKAEMLGLNAGVLTFSPLPQLFFARDKDKPFRLLMTEVQKKLFAAQLGMAFYGTLLFDKRMANSSAEAFIQEILIEQLAIRHLVVGFDFRFGKGRLGSVQLLKNYQDYFGLTVVEAQLDSEGEKISSSKIRQLIDAKNFQKAKEMLGRSASLLL